MNWRRSHRPSIDGAKELAFLQSFEGEMGDELHRAYCAGQDQPDAAYSWAANEPVEFTIEPACSLRSDAVA